MVTTAGTSTWPIRLGDNATPGAGTFELFFHTAPANISETDVEVLIVNTDVQDATIAVSWGASKHGWIFNRCKLLLTSASGAGGWIEIIKRAKAYWSANNTLVYLTVKDANGYNQAVHGDISGTSVRAVTVKFIGYERKDEDSENATVKISVIKVD